MKATDPDFSAMMNQISEYISEKAGREYSHAFGGAVLVAIPSGFVGRESEVVGWINDDEDEEGRAKLMLPCLFALCMSALRDESIGPQHLFGVVLQALAESGRAVVVDTDDPFDGMTRN